MDLEVTFLGTGASAPSARRSTAAVLVARGGDRLLFDCGEGTQRQMQRSLGLTQVDEIYLTHFHADHMLGLPGLLKTYDLTDREAPLRVFGPPGLKELFTVLRPLIGRLRYPLELGELKAGGDGSTTTNTRSRRYEAAHNVRAFGWALVEDERPGRFDPEAAKAAGVREGPDFARLQRGEEVEGSNGTVTPDQVMGETRAGRIIVVTGDTAPSPAHGRRRGRRRAADPRRQLRRGGRPAGRRNRPLDPRPGRRGGRRGAREDCSPWSTSPPATTSARCSRRPARSSPTASPPATSTRSSSRSRSEVRPS